MARGGGVVAEAIAEALEEQHMWMCCCVGRRVVPQDKRQRPGRSESLDRPLDRLSRATLLARSRSTEAPRGDLGRSWPLPGVPRPFRIAFPCRRERDFSKLLTSLLDRLLKPSGTHFETIWAALGTLLGLFWALLGRPGPLLERSRGTPGDLFGALLAFSRRTWDRRGSGPPLGSIFKQFWIILGVDMGAFGDRIL